MISEGEARARILAAVGPLHPCEHAPLDEALDRYAAKDASATVALPAFDNSAMDGYAVIAADAKHGARLKVVGEQPAGRARNLCVSAGEAVRIFTGAPLPAGADAVIMQEEVERETDFITIGAERVSRGEFVRKAGADLALGQKILEGGQRIGPATLGLIASQGLESIEVFPRATVAIVSTGDEIVPAGKNLRPGEIFESNGVMLSALVKRAGGQLVTCRHVRDNFADLCAVLLDASKADAVIVSGGVSVGEHDLVRRALGEIGADIDLWRVKIKPGKPFLFGRRNECAIFGLPGNPVSSFITFLVLVRPALLKMMGANDAALSLPEGAARLTHDIAGDETRPHYIRGRVERSRFAEIGRQESHALHGLARANALLRLEAGQSLAAGREVALSLLD